MYHHFMLNINKKVPHYVLMKKNGFVWGFFEIKNNKSAAGMQHAPATRHYFSISTHIPSLKKIGKKMPKIESENIFLTSIKGYNSVLICQNLPIHNPRTLLYNIDSYTKFEENQ